jgi:hypothetical protein
LSVEATGTMPEAPEPLTMNCIFAWPNPVPSFQENGKEPFLSVHRKKQIALYMDSYLSNMSYAQLLSLLFP